MNIRVDQNVFLRTLKNAGTQSIWFIHGFAESSFCFVDLFETPLQDHFNLYAPDLPGFGVTPLHAHGGSFREAGQILLDLIERISPGDRVYLVGHSLGAVICTHVAQQHPGRIAALVSIEGNLTEADAYYSGQATKHETGAGFKQAFLRQVFEMAGEGEALQRYYASVHLAHPEAMMQWGQASAQFSKASVVGREFKALACPTLYYWGAKSTPEPTQRYIQSEAIVNKRFEGSGHWPMIDQPDRCAQDVLEFFLST